MLRPLLLVWADVESILDEVGQSKLILRPATRLQKYLPRRIVHQKTEVWDRFLWRALQWEIFEIEVLKYLLKTNTLVLPLQHRIYFTPFRDYVPTKL